MTFANEAEEAAWWESHEDELADEFEKATAEGRAGIGTVAKRAALPTTTIRLDPDDIAKARVLAAERGLRYQTYLKMIIHEALLTAEKKDVSMKIITLTKTQQGFRIDPPMGTADGAAGSGLPERYTSQDRLQARLRSYGFTNEEIARALRALEEKGELDLPLPLRNVA